jgi:acyl dehydratase
MSADFRARARLVPKGNRHEDFEPARVFQHHWGRAITESESTVFGLTVEDLSEGGGPFLGVNQLTYHKPVYPGDSLRAESIVLDRRLSDSHKGFGIVTWHTRGFNQREEEIIDLKRTNLVRQRVTQ